MRRERSADADIANCCASLPGWHRAKRTWLDGGAVNAAPLCLHMHAADRCLQLIVKLTHFFESGHGISGIAADGPATNCWL